MQYPIEVDIFDPATIARCMRSLPMNTDSYKPSHWLQYPENTEYLFYNIESRGGKYEKTVVFGPQMYAMEYLTEKVTLEQVVFADKFYAMHGEPFFYEGWMRLIEKYDGILPLEIRSVPEGTVMPAKQVIATVINTDPEFSWIDIETSMLRGVWYPTTVASQSWQIKQVIKGYLEKTGDVAGLPFKLHDFGARGVSSFESAAIGGASHLLNFMGSDTVSGILQLMRYYKPGAMPAYSIPAAQHSTTTILGIEGETSQFARMVRKLAKQGGLFAVVSDGFDIDEACVKWGTDPLKQMVIDSGATLVVRPDSGDPATIVLRCLKALEAGYGSTVNSKGYKVLNYVRVIQGDGINEESIREILDTAIAAGFSADNIAFGMGGALLQQVNRDTNKFAMKLSAAMIDGTWVDVYKDPKTDPGKKSKKGRVITVKNLDGSWDTIRAEDFDSTKHVDQMRTIYKDGKMMIEDDLATIRARTEVF
jgi:nicotinamide phosphoribosyltransferase